MKLLRLAVIASLPLLNSCALFLGTSKSGTEGTGQQGQALRQIEETEQKEVLGAARTRIANVHGQIAAGRFSEAEATLAPLANSTLYPEEVAELKAKIAAGKERTVTSAVRRQIAVARRLAFRNDFDEAQAILDSLDANGPCKEEIKEVRELVNLKRIKMPAATARKQVSEIRRFIQRGDLGTADSLLQALEMGGAVPQDVAVLKLELAAAKRAAGMAVEQQASANQALGEVDDALVLPKTYNKTVVISPNLNPLEMPVGSMEDLINKKVSIQLNNAGVKELVQVLSQVDGLNIIADDALEAEKSLTINVKDVPLKEVLSYIARNMGIAFYLGENIVWVTESTEEPGSGPQLETRIFQLRQGFIPTLKAEKKDDQGGGGGQPGEDDTDLEDALDAFLADSPEGATYRVFKTRNVLVVRDTRENLRTVEELVKTFDKAPYQVRIEARFITISQNDLYDVGSELSLTPDIAPVAGDANAQLQVTDLLTSLGALQADNKDGVGYADLGGVLGNRAYSLIISALDKQTSTKNLSAPRITVLNNHSARIRSGKTTLYYSELDTVASTASSTTGDSNSSIQTAFTGTPDEIESGVTLDVKVNVGNDGKTVLIGLKPEIIEISQWRSFNVIAGGDSTSNNNNSSSNTDNAQGNIELPETSENSLQTAVAIRSGETVALGGLVTSNVQKTVSKVPILGDIPLLGFFFRHTTEKNEPQHLLIFVTARVIDQDGNFVRVAE
jgi:type IV pilus assembly protein PilQ